MICYRCFQKNVIKKETEDGNVNGEYVKDTTTQPKRFSHGLSVNKREKN